MQRQQANVWVIQEEYVEGVEKHDLETQATIERERITSAAVKQLKAEIKDEKSKHEAQVRKSCCMYTASQLACIVLSAAVIDITPFFARCLCQL